MLIGLLVAASIFAITAALAWQDLRYGLYFLVATLPLDNRIVFTLGLPRLLPVRAVLLAVIFVSLIKWRKKYWVWFKPNHLFEDGILVLLSALWIIRLISLINADHLGHSLGLLSFYTAVLALYFILRAAYSVHGKDFVLQLLYLYLFVGFATGFVSVAQFIAYEFFDFVLPAVWPTEYQPVRIGGTFWDINHYAGFLVTVIPSFIALAIAKVKIKKRWLYICASLFLLIILGMTLSRSGWAAFVVAVGTMLVLFLIRGLFKEFKILTGFVILLVAASVVGSLYFGLPIVDRLHSLRDIPNNDAIKAHAMILASGFEVFTMHPIIGGGYGGFNEDFRKTSLADDYFAKDPVQDAHIPAHSVWMEVLAETGVLGFTFYTLFIFMLLHTLFDAIWQSKDRLLVLLNTAAVGSILGLLVSGIFYSYNLEFFWFFLFNSLFLARETISEA